MDHYNAENVYLRVMGLPANRLILSYIHKFSCISILLEGEIIIFHEDKSKKRLKAPYVFESKAGLRRAIYSITPIKFATAHGTGHIPNWVAVTKGMDDDIIKSMFACATQEEYVTFLETRSQYGQIQDLRT
jgi:hypothetical protein